MLVDKTTPCSLKGTHGRSQLMQRRRHHETDSTFLPLGATADAVNSPLDEVESDQRISTLELDSQGTRRTLKTGIAGGINLGWCQAESVRVQRSADLAVLAGVGALQRGHDDVQRRALSQGLCLGRLPGQGQPAHAWAGVVRNDVLGKKFCELSVRKRRRVSTKACKLVIGDEAVVTRKPDERVNARRQAVCAFCTNQLHGPLTSCHTDHQTVHLVQGHGRIRAEQERLSVTGGKQGYAHG